MKQNFVLWGILFSFWSATTVLSATALQLPTPTQGEHSNTEVQDTAKLPLLEFIGSLGTANAFLAYTNVVLIGDAYMAGVQADSTAIMLLTGVENVVQLSLKPLQQLRSSSQLSADERTAIGEMELIFSGIQNMIAALKRFIDDGTADKTLFDQYETARRHTWQRLSRFLGIR